MSRSEAPQDPRPYGRISVDLPLNPKLATIDNPAAGWAYVTSILYCVQSLTDGHFPIAAVLRLAGVDMAIAMALAEQELWHLPGHDCDRCPQPKKGHAYVHDFLQHQRSGDEARDLTNKRREAGRKGAQRRWANEQMATDDREELDSKPIANAMASAEQPLWQTDGKSIAEERRGEERRERVKNISPPKPGGGAPEGFDEFWSAYPRKDGKTEARTAYAKAIKKANVTPELLTAGASRYAGRMQRDRTERSKIKMAQGWLNNDRWEDESTEPALAYAGPRPFWEN